MPVLTTNDPKEQVKPGLSRKIIYIGDLMTVILDFEDGPWESPESPHSHPHVQTSYLASGEIIFFCEGEEPQHLKPGDVFAVPPNAGHCIQLISPNARLIDSFYPLREDFLKDQVDKI